MVKKSAIGQSDAILASDFIALVVVKDRHIVWANAAMHHAFGYQPDELIGLSTRCFFLDQEAYEAFGEDAYAAIAAKGLYSGTIQQKRKDGSAGWYQFNVSRIAGQEDMLVGAIVDQTSSHQALAALEMSRLVVEDQTEVISRFRADGTFVFVNDVYCRVFGKTAGELLGHRWQPVAHPDDLPMIEARLGEMSPEHPVVTIENRIMTLGQALRWMQFVNRGFFDAAGRLTEIQSVGHDITNLKEAEARLRDSEERLELALQGSGLVLWDWNIADRTVTAGRRWSALLGFTVCELGCGEDQWLGLIHPDDLEAFTQRMDSHLQGNIAVFESEHRLRHKDGHWVHVLAYGKVTARDAVGGPLRVVGTVQDITQRKRLNEDGLALLRRIEAMILDTGRASSHRPADSAVLESLTKRERRILCMIAEGLTSPQIAVRLHVATSTVISHRQKMMAKLGLHSTAEVVRFALDRGLLRGS